MLKKYKFEMVAMIATAALGATTTLSRANLILNGGFETGDFTDYSLSGNTASGTLVLYDPPGAHSGNHFAELAAVGSLDLLTQTIPTTIGTTYDVTYYLDNNGGTPSIFFASTAPLATLQSLPNDSSAQTVDASFALPGTFLYDAPGFSYSLYTTSFVATSSITYFTIASRQDPGAFGLDDIDVETGTAGIPEPASLSLIALGGLGLLVRREHSMGLVA